MIKISHDHPPNWNKLVKLFGVKWEHVVVTYGDTCYCKNYPSPDLIVHETVHMWQQEIPNRWWKRYYKDSKFRLAQETEAYQEQFKFIRLHVKDRNLLFKIRDKLALDLSGKMYDKCIDYQTAFKVIGG